MLSRTLTKPELISEKAGVTRKLNFVRSCQSKEGAGNC